MSNVAELTFPVMVVDTTLVVTLSAEPMEIEAGGTSMITATANRYVTAGDGAVKIDLAVVRDVGVWGAMERKVRLATAVSGVSERPELAPSDRFRHGERVASQQVDVLVAER